MSDVTSAQSLGGLWWTPGNEAEPFPGTLTLLDRRMPTLAVFDAPSSALGTSAPVPAIHGKVEGIGPLSLIGCTWGGMHLAGTQTHKLRVRAAVTGWFLDGPDDKAFRRMEAVVPALGGLLGLTGHPIRRPGPRSQQMTISTDTRRRTWKSSSTGVTATFEFVRSWEQLATGTKIQMIPSISLKHRSPQSADFWLFKWLLPLIQLLELGCGHQVNPDSVSLWDLSSERGLKRERSRARVYMRGVGSGDEPDTEEALFQVDQIDSDPEAVATIVERLPALEDEQSVFFSLLGEAMRSPDRPLRNRFVDVVSALEAFHSVRFGRGPIDAQTFKAARKRVINAVRSSDVSTQDAKFVAKWLEPGSRFRLAHRIQALATTCGVDSKSWDVSVDEVVRLRNDVAHGVADPNGARLKQAFSQVLDLARRLALFEVGAVGKFDIT